MITRRQSLQLFGAVLAQPFLEKLALTQEGSGKWDVLYDAWEEDIETVLDLEDTISRYMGEDLAHELRVVKRNDGKFGLIYDRDGTERSSEATVTSQNKVLSNIDVHAQAIKDEGYSHLYNVSYGKGKNLEALKKEYDVIKQVLGKGVGKELYIEQSTDTQFVLIYRRRGDLESTKRIAQLHQSILRPRGMDASFTAENNNEVVWGIASNLDQKVSKEVKITKAPAKKQPHNSLEQQLESLTANYHKSGKLALDETAAWYIYDLNAEQEIVNIHKEQPLQCASMMKPFLALAYFHKLGKRKYNSEARGKLELMIQKSNNNAANWFIEQVGGAEKVNELLHFHYGSLFVQTKFIEKIPPGGRTYKNKASAADYGRFLRALWNNKLPYSHEIKRAMALPKRNRLYYGAAKVPSETLVYDKTGSTNMLCGDMGILVGQGNDGKRYPYVLVGIIEKDRHATGYSPWIHARGALIREVSNTTYEYFKEKYDLV